MLRIREHLQFRIIVSIKDRLDATTPHADERLVQYRKETERRLQKIVDGDDSRAAELESRLDDLFGLTYSNAELAMTQHQQTLNALQAIPAPTGLGLFPTNHVRRNPTEYDFEQKQRKDKEVLNKLRFRKMVDRFEDIAAAHKATFQWIFEEDQASKPRPWSNFRTWLREGNGIYWLSGKAASGKSTLMKYIDRHKKLRDLLGAWAGHDQLIVSSFYFWHNGTLMQRTLLGMLQALLCQVLEERNELISMAFPEQMQRDMYGPRGLTMPEIKGAMSRVVRKARENGLKLCFLIDGLDEFEGGEAEMADLASYLASIVKSAQVKIVAASRPLAVFEDAFVDCAQLRLQDLTSDDITAYVNSSVDKKERMVTLRQQAPQEAAELVSGIVTKASGVFLWVKLVVRSLLEGLRAFDDIDDLKARLEELPPALEDLYRFMLQKVSPRYRVQASRLIQIVRQNASIHDTPLPTLLLSFAFEKEHDSAIVAPISPLTTDEKFRRCREIDIKLRTRTAGLLEVQHKLYTFQNPSLAAPQSQEYVYLVESHVQFLHKSVTDFLDTLGASDGLLSNGESDFNPSVSLLRAYLMQLKTMERYDHAHWRALRSAVTFARMAEQTEERDQTALVDQLDVVMSHFVQTSPQYHWSETNAEYRYNKGTNQDSFLSFCMQSGLYHYTKTAFQSKGAGLLIKPGRPLLDYVLCPWHMHESAVFGCNVELAALLVSYGAKLTDCFDNQTLYQRFFRYLLNTEILSLSQCERYISIFHVLFDGKMDVKATLDIEVDLFTGQKQKRRYSVLRLIRMVFIERASSLSTDGLIPQVWMTRLVFDDKTKAAAKSLEHRALSLGAKDKEWHDGELVLPPSSSRLRVDFSKLKDVWKRKST